MGKRACILIIGNEILSAKTVDSNSAYLCRELRNLGVEVREISVIPDEVETIAHKVRTLSEQFDFVFTSGGVGPTHDDVTIEGVALAFQTKVIHHPALVKILKTWHKKEELNDARLKMADVPEGSELLGQDTLSFPLIAYKNIYIFPGIPEILKEKFEAVKESFREAPYYAKIVYVTTPEGKLAAYMNQLMKEYPLLMVGSYPELHNPEYRVKVTLESKEKPYLDEALDHFVNALPSDAVVNIES